VNRPLVAVLDYGIGNLHSARKAIERGGADARLTNDVAVAQAADAVVLPGVGAFGSCVEALHRSGLAEAARAAAVEATQGGRPFLGICIGMQLLFDTSEESPGIDGLGVISGVVERLPSSAPVIPQMQWNRLAMLRHDPLVDVDRVDGDGVWMYFDHSYHGVPDDPDVVVATVEYGGTVNAMFRSGNAVAVQFHPEKSSRDGLALLADFVRTQVPR
jgi:glutamine amidotransferase